MYIFCVKTVKNWDPLFLELKRSWEMESSSRRGMASLFKKTGRSESTTCRKVPGPCKLAALKELNDKSFSKRMTNHQPSSSRTVLYKAAPDFHTQIPTPPKCTHTHTRPFTIPVIPTPHVRLFPHPVHHASLPARLFQLLGVAPPNGESCGSDPPLRWVSRNTIWRYYWFPRPV